MNRIVELETRSKELMVATAKFPSVKEVCYELLEIAREAQADYAEVDLRKRDLVEVRHNGCKPDINLKQQWDTLAKLACISQLRVYFKDSQHCERYDFSTKCTESSHVLLKPGCIFQASSLFKNLPSRYEELISSSEQSLESAFNQFSIENPRMGLKLFKNGELLTHNEIQSFCERLKVVMKIPGELRPFTYTSLEVSFRGYLTQPTDSCHHKQLQYWLYRGQIFECESLSKCINSVYKDASRLLSSSFTE